jgi:hypothetical protein
MGSVFVIVFCFGKIYLFSFKTVSYNQGGNFFCFVVLFKVFGGTLEGTGSYPVPRIATHDPLS